MRSPNAFANLSMTVSIPLRRQYHAFTDAEATDYNPYFSRYLLWCRNEISLVHLRQAAV
ncbi:conserved protein of unknown function [Ectopseudomonas oleovorans]|uniref:Uncharacterized protein n=1 Tax=Ectopseudomonas oleovorans TaxID=301 RepID=A0A653BBS4_ECTOL|nr:conserved protein of unknown function [Pseudomonas oleovorans]